MQRSEKHLRLAIGLCPDNGSFKVELGVVLQKEGKAQEAVALLRKVTEENPGNVQAQYVLARALQETGSRTEAAEHFQKASNLNHGEINLKAARVLTLEGASELQKGEVDEAVVTLRKALEELPGFPDANYYLGIALAKKGDSENALQAFETAQAGRPADPEICYNFGIALWHVAKATAAIDEFRQAIQLKPNYGLAHCALGKALIHEGQTVDGQNEIGQARRFGACGTGNSQ